MRILFYFFLRAHSNSCKFNLTEEEEKNKGFLMVIRFLFIQNQKLLVTIIHFEKINNNNNKKKKVTSKQFYN